MQKYILLESQREVIRRRLSLQLPSTSPMTATSPEFHSLTSSPTSARDSSSSIWSPEPSYMPAYPMPTEPISVRRSNMGDTACDSSNKSCEINQQIKATLTELLNTESVRADEKYRAWIQERLMDAEHQIRRQRRRRSSIDREIAEHIAESL
ncbi:hypothetical protein CC78DRAFT_378858 [Lojkania enalia]|uniref:Uncharacterized protein n=1 Tax=Lojkania enalia TaxID=147567 RepID=A0A9P4N6M6_9PLEO|nr:hypothetical protein CC78DRAFT_378858 [Didymosphaeria enalia]